MIKLFLQCDRGWMAEGVEGGFWLKESGSPPAQLQSVAIVTEAESRALSLKQAERSTANASLQTLLPPHSYYFLFTSLFLLKEEVNLWDLPTGWAGF